MLMDGLALVVVLGVNQTIRTGKGLRRLIGFEAQIAFLIFVRSIGISQTAITQHEIVVCLQILGIDGHCFLELIDRFLIFVLQEKNPANIVDNHTVLRILLFSDS